MSHNDIDLVTFTMSSKQRPQDLPCYHDHRSKGLYSVNVKKLSLLQKEFLIDIEILIETPNYCSVMILNMLHWNREGFSEFLILFQLFLKF